eukprot:1060029-Prymnesium_polylepis.1
MATAGVFSITMFGRTRGGEGYSRSCGSTLVTITRNYTNRYRRTSLHTDPLATRDRPVKANHVCEKSPSRSAQPRVRCA